MSAVHLRISSEGLSGIRISAEGQWVHCFTGNKKVLEQYLSMGFSIGITGWICDDRRAKELRKRYR